VVSRFVPALRFHWLTRYYDAVVAVTTRERTIKQALVAQADIRPGQHVLDLACGTGTLAVWIKQACPQTDVVGLDADREILSLAARKADFADVLIQFQEGMSRSLPYPDEHFDRVVSSLFFHHLSWRDKERTIQEIFRILRPGGELHIADWGEAANLAMRVLFVSVQLLDGFANTRDSVTGKLVDLFQLSGFDEVSKGCQYNTIFGTLAIYRAVKPGQSLRQPT